MRTPSYTAPPKEVIQTVVAEAQCMADVIRGLGYTRLGNTEYRSVKRWLKQYGISTDHFDLSAVISERNQQKGRPLSERLCKDSPSTSGLKKRLYREGIKQRSCELCGQGEVWRGQHISLILDHINGDPTDNRLENLRILCPNCNAAQPTHCRGTRPPVEKQHCKTCGAVTGSVNMASPYCSKACRPAHVPNSKPMPPRLEARRAERPPYPELVAEVQARGYSAVGRHYGVSDNAIRKWVKSYQKELGISEEVCCLPKARSKHSKEGWARRRSSVSSGDPNLETEA